MKEQLSTTTKQMIADLQDDLAQMLELDSNIEVIWRLESLHNNEAFMKSANHIRRSLEQKPSEIKAKDYNLLHKNDHTMLYHFSDHKTPVHVVYNKRLDRDEMINRLKGKIRLQRRK